MQHNVVNIITSFMTPVFIDFTKLNICNHTYFHGDFFYTIVDNKRYPIIKFSFFDKPLKIDCRRYKVNEKDSACYFLLHKPTGQFYIGSSGDIYRRIVKHIGMIKNKYHDNKKLNDLLTISDLDNFDVLILFCDDRESAYTLEQLFLNNYKESPFLLNFGFDVKGAWLGKNKSEEFKAYMSSVHKGKSKSKEHRTKISNSRKESEKAICQLKTIQAKRALSVNIDGTEYRTLTDAANHLKVSLSFIWKLVDKNKKLGIENPYIVTLNKTA